jgi:hypothetical protein
MFADTDGAAVLPKGVGTVSPGAVADTVVNVVQRNKAEADVAPLLLRAGVLIGSLAPRLSASAQARVGRRLSEQLIAAQRHKR